MSPSAVVLLSLGMSTDAFAAALSRGVSQQPSTLNAIKTGLIFGIVEMITPLLGWASGYFAVGILAKAARWIAFALLAAVGTKMIWTAIKPDASRTGGGPVRPGARAMIVTAFGTSADGAVVGMGLALIRANIWVISVSIGLGTFLCTTIAMLIGQYAGTRFGTMSEALGGFVLIAIGTIMIMHSPGFA